MQEYLEKTRQELRLRNYSLKTVKSYLSCLGEYFDFKKFNLEKIDEENIKQFLLNKQDKNYSSQTINLYLKEYFSFWCCRVKRGNGGAIIRAYNFCQNYHALRARDIKRRPKIPEKV